MQALLRERWPALALGALLLGYYLYPLAAMGMLLGVLIELPIAFLAIFLITVLLAVLTRGEVQLFLFPTLAAMIGTLAVGKAERLNSFVNAGIWVSFANLTALAAFRLPYLYTDSRGLAELSTAALVNGVLASSVALVVFYLLSQLLGITTSLQLLELSRPTHPLLRELLLKAPGTYHHTILVSNMIEEAARDRKSTRLNSSHIPLSRMPSSA